ncbi:MAG: hypothetical protein LCH52_05410 [Bacteroidetes bacterium]|nr:hypothetical protein [Bacteroidota bacterium]
MNEVVITLKSNAERLEKELEKAGNAFSNLLKSASKRVEVAISTRTAEANIKRTSNMFDNFAGRVIALNQSLEVAKSLILGFSDDVKASATLGVLRDNFKGTAEDIKLFQQATAGTVKEATLLELSNQATELGVTLQDQAVLFNIAEDAADKFGGSTDDNFKALVFTTEGATRALKNLGIQKDVYEKKLSDLAAAEGKTVDQLDGEAEKRLRVRAVIELTGQTLDDVAKKQRDNADTLEEMGVSFQGVKEKIAEGFLPVIKTVGEIIIAFNNWVQGLSASLRVAIGVIGFVTTAFLLLGNTLSTKFYMVTLVTGAVITLMTALREGKPVIAFLSSLVAALGVSVMILRTSFISMAHGWVFNLSKMSTSLGLARVQLKLAAMEGRLFAGAMTAAGMSVKAFFASLGPIGWIMLGLSAVATIWATLSENIDEAKQKTEDYEKTLERKATTDNTEVVALQAKKVGYNLLANELSKTNAKSEERNVLASRISKEYPDLIKNINLNTASEKELGIWKDWVNKQFDMRIKLMILEKKAALVTEDIAKKELELIDLPKSKVDVPTPVYGFYGNYNKADIAYAKNNNLEIDKKISNIQNELSDKNKLLEDITKKADAMKATVVTGSSGPSGAGGGSKEKPSVLKGYEQNLSDLEEERRKTDIENIKSDEETKYQIELAYLKKKKDLADQAMKLTGLTQDEKNRLELASLDLHKQILESEIKHGKEALDKQFKADAEALKRKQDLEEAESDGKDLTRLQELENEKLHLEQKLALYRQYGKDVSDIEHEIALNLLKTKNARIEKEKEDLKKKDDFEKMLFDSQVMSEAKQFDVMRQKNDEWLSEKLKEYELTEQQRAELYRTHEEKNSEVNEKESEYRLGKTREILSNMKGIFAENTVAYKAFAIANATIGTYEAAVTALKAGPILGPILMGTIIAAGLGQVANIIATEVPGYAKGGAVVGENGPEIITPMQDYASGQVLLATETANAVQRAMLQKDGLMISGSNSDLMRALKEWPYKVRFDLGLDSLKGSLERINYRDGLAI